MSKYCYKGTMNTGLSSNSFEKASSEYLVVYCLFMPYSLLLSVLDRVKVSSVVKCVYCFALIGFFSFIVPLV
jgi:hypothetical protein